MGAAQQELTNEKKHTVQNVSKEQAPMDLDLRVSTTTPG
jgi:hypothetical protein